MSDVLAAVLEDLAAESRWLFGVLDGLDDSAWERATPAPGWTVHDQIGHLAYFDEVCHEAATDPARFATRRDALLAGGPDFPDRVAAEARSRSHGDVAAWFRGSRADLLAGLVGRAGADRIPWFGPDMGVTSAATARLMETWAHGRDVADALGVVQPATGRLRHVADLGVRTRGFSYAVRGRTVPVEPVRVELEAPGGATWSWGDPGAADAVRGPAEDFCLVVTQRRHVDNTSVTTTGAAAREWLELAQAFAGAATTRPAAVRT